MSLFADFGGSGNIQVQQSGVNISFRPNLNFVTGATIADDPTNNRTNITIVSGGAGNLDGGRADSIYGGTSPLDGGGA